MSEKRRDSKGRLLRNGESQRSDGKYEYKYTDAKGIRHSAYSWKLVDTDKVPAGKRCIESLCEIEKRIQRDIQDGINTYESSRTTLDEYYEGYIASKKELKQSTRTNYKYMYQKYVKEKLGHLPIAKIKYSDIRKFYLSLIHDLGFKPNSMEIINTILHPVFAMAVRDEMIRFNFCEDETNLKVIQEIMGHADITTPMDVYNEANREKKVESFANNEAVGAIRVRIHEKK